MNLRSGCCAGGLGVGRQRLSSNGLVQIRLLGLTQDFGSDLPQLALHGLGMGGADANHCFLPGRQGLQARVGEAVLHRLAHQLDR